MDQNLNQGIEAIIPTAGRAAVLYKTLESISRQGVLPTLVHIIDASEDTSTELVCKKISELFPLKIKYYKAAIKGAAAQRMQAMQFIRSQFTLFTDDDIILEKNCIQLLQNLLISQHEAGGVNAMVTNQQYHKPGRLTSFMYKLMNGSSLKSYAGKCIGPAWNLLPEENGEQLNETEWLNTTCTLYRTVALPEQLFPPIFQGYSLMEDLALSLEVRKRWKLYNVPSAKIFHDSQSGDHKNSAFIISKMEMINRHYIMKNILGKKGFTDYLKFLIFECWNIISSLNTAKGRQLFLKTITGKFSAFYQIILNHK